MPPEIQLAVTDVLARNDAALLGATQFAMTAYDCEQATCFVSIAGFDDTLLDAATWSLDQAVFIGTIVVTKRADGQYVGMLERETGFRAMAAQSLSPRAVQLFAAQTTSDTLPYDFPWEPGTSMVYGVLGVHKGGFIDGWRAVDFLSDGNTSLNHGPNKLLTAAAGTVTYVCDDGVNLAVRIGDLIYVHLLPNDRLRVGQVFARGAELGPLKPGTYSTRCGFANQQPQNFHVHLAFPPAETFTMGGWTLNVSDGVWRNGDRTWRTGLYLKNDAQVSTPDPNVTPSPEPTLDPNAPTATPSPTLTPRPPTATRTPSPTTTPLPTITPTPTQTPSPTVTPTPTPRPGICALKRKGDANCDDVIDGFDFSLWLTAQCAGRCRDRRADFNRDGRVNTLDYALWVGNRALNRRTTSQATQVSRRDQVRLILVPAVTNGVDIGLLGATSTDYVLKLAFSPVRPARPLHYARVEVRLPEGVVLTSVGPGVNVSQARLPRVFRLSDTADVNESKTLLLELGAQTNRSGPNTLRAITLATFRIAANSTSGVARFTLQDAQIVTSGPKQWPVLFESLELLLNPRRLYLPVLVRDNPALRSR